MKIKFAGPLERGAGSGICVGAGGITGISADEEGGSVEEEGASASDGAVEGGLRSLTPGLPGSSESYCWIIKIPIVLFNISHINGKTQALQGPRIRLNSLSLT